MSPPIGVRSPLVDGFHKRLLLRDHGSTLDWRCFLRALLFLLTARETYKGDQVGVEVRKKIICLPGLYIASKQLVAVVAGAGRQPCQRGHKSTHTIIWKNKYMINIIICPSSGKYKTLEACSRVPSLWIWSGISSAYVREWNVG